MNEIWKDIKDYEGLYQISNLGRVKSLYRLVKCRGGSRSVPERILHQYHLTKIGYKTVTLSKQHCLTTVLVHRLVAEAFIPNPNNLPCINHKDADVSNNNVNNLEWCTYEYNSNYYICKQKQSIAMKQRYSDLATLHDNIPKPHPVCQLDLDGNLIKIYSVLREVEVQGFCIRNVRNCADCLGGKWNKPSHHGFSKTHKGYRWVWLEDYNKGVH